MSHRHKVFVSYHHENDQKYKDLFEELFSEVHHIMESRSVQDDDIDPNTKTETVRQIIRDDYLQDSTVTVVLIGTETWKRKHVDWEIAASISHTKASDRSGLIGIFLPAHCDYGRDKYNPYIIPPRLYRNAECGYAKLYDWHTNPNLVQAWIHEAFKRRKQENLNPHNSDLLFGKNRTGDSWQK
ncbi:MAG: TIR domain-containing protein [Candidatus Poribacteria bacterium]|nr:TIR domain-containing protein [Candidatus Poribacteria bacterium]